MNRKTTIITSLCLAILLAGCGTTIQTPGFNQNPIADAGPDASAMAGELVTLSAAGSTDLDGDSLSYTWAKTNGPSLKLQDSNQRELSLTPKFGGTYEFTVTVTDGKGGSDQDTVRLSVTGPADPNPPDSGDPTPGDGTGCASGGDLDGDGVLDCEDNCVTVINSTQDDFDGDGTGDACDSDDDDDGFRDIEDPDPLDRDNPGDFSTPEKILNNPIILDAIQEFHDQGFGFEPSLNTNPPDISGTFTTMGTDIQFVATGNGESVGDPACDDEFTTTVAPNLTFTEEAFLTCGGETGEVSTSTGLVRGEGSSYTTYTTSRSVCVESGSSYATFVVGIVTGFVSATGDLRDLTGIYVTVATQGVLTSTCQRLRAGDTEFVGGWQAEEIRLSTRRN